MSGPRILVVRLGSMGDIIHTLPAVATLKHSYPGAHVAWVVDPAGCLSCGQPVYRRTDTVQPPEDQRGSNPSQAPEAESFDTAFDFQGLIKSALIASMTRPERIYGFHHLQLREKFAGLIYSTGCWHDRRMSSIATSSLQQVPGFQQADRVSHPCRRAGG